MGNRAFLKFSLKSACRIGRIGFLSLERSWEWLKKTDRWYMNPRWKLAANAVISIRKEGPFFLLCKFLLGMLGYARQWRKTGRARQWEKLFSARYPLVVFEPPYTNDRGMAPDGVEQRTDWGPLDGSQGKCSLLLISVCLSLPPTRRKKKILWHAYVDTQNYADGKSEKNLSSAMATRHCCNSCVKCMMSMSLSNQKKRGETGCKKDLSESSLSVEKS